jgi:hypothetical protein
VTTTLTQVATGTSATIRVVTSYDSDTQVDNVVHVIIGSGIPDFTIKPAHNTSFMVTGRIGLRFDPDTQRVCLVTVDYTELS